MDSAVKSKYASKLMLDSLLIVFILAMLYGVQIFLTYSVLSEAWDIIPSGLHFVYIVFLGALLSVETIGCLKVRQSIKQHMHEFEYYD